MTNLGSVAVLGLLIAAASGCQSHADSNISTCTQWCEDFRTSCHASGSTDCMTICMAEENVAEMTGCTTYYDSHITCEQAHPASTACGVAPCNDTSVYPCEQSYCMAHSNPLGCF